MVFMDEADWVIGPFFANISVNRRGPFISSLKVIHVYTY